MSRYFNEIEFNRCTPSCSERDMDADFIQILDRVREGAGIPLHLTCAYRSREWDLRRGRSGNSAHTRGKAVDISAPDSATRFRIVKSALAQGITRIGIGRNFVHLDNDTTLPQHIIFHYY